METNGNKNDEKKITKKLSNVCHYKCSNKTDVTYQSTTLKHQNSSFGNKNDELTNNKFICEKCNYVCSYKFNLDRHLKSRKHLETNDDELSKTTPLCSCGKSFKSRSGLWKHKKICNVSLEEKEKT